MRFYRVYQLPHNHNNLFRDLDSVNKVDIGDYCCVWADELQSPEKKDLDVCEDLFRTFNIEHPKGFGGHSMSVSDIVMIADTESKERVCYYCDSFGFKKLAI